MYVDKVVVIVVSIQQSSLWLCFVIVGRMYAWISMYRHNTPSHDYFPHPIYLTTIYMYVCMYKSPFLLGLKRSLIGL